MPTSLQSGVGDNKPWQVPLSAQLAVGDSGDHLVAATTSEFSSSRDPWSFLVGGQTELAVDSKSAVDDPIEKTGAVFGDTKSAVGDSSVSIGSVYMSEDINSARQPFVAVNEGHEFHATLKHLKIRDPTSEKSKNISRPIFLLCGLIQKEETSDRHSQKHVSKMISFFLRKAFEELVI